MVKFMGANMGPIWVLSAPDGPHVAPLNLAIRVVASDMLMQGGQGIRSIFVDLALLEYTSIYTLEHTLWTDYEYAQ